MTTRIFKTLTRLGSQDYRCSNNRHIPNPWVPKASSAPKFSSSATVADVSSINGARPISSSQSQENKNGSKWSKLALFLPGAITFGLGTWQIVRRQDKIKTLEYRQQRLEMEPMKLDNELLPSENLDSLEFRRVVCKGVFDEGRSIYVGPRSRSISGVTENGYYVITPLMPIPGSPESVQSPVLVNRGWVPRSWRDTALQRSDDTKQRSDPETVSAKSSGQQPSWWKFWSRKSEITEDQAVPTITPIEVIGVIRTSEKPSIFVPANDPNSSQWFYVDVPGMARALGFPENTIYIEDINDDINPSKPYPVPKDVNTLIRSSVMPQDHLNYTFTWYSLSAAVTFMAYKRLKPKAGRR